MKKQFMIVIAAVAIIVILAALFILGRRSNDARSNFQKGYLKEADTAFLNGDLLSAKKLYEQAREKIDDTARLK